MDSMSDIGQLNDRTILLILNYLTQDIRSTLTEEDMKSVASAEDAENLVAAMLIETGETSEPKEMKETLTDQEVASAGRRLLSVLRQDPTLGPKVEELVANPPQDDQMSVELAIAGAVLLGAVVSWLQTKVKIHYSRKDGKTQFEFDLEKRPASTSLLKNVVKSVSGLFSGLG